MGSVAPLLVDSRAGSKELVRPLRDLGLPVDETTLEFGDLCFVGRGEGGAPLLIGVEHKKLNDLVQSLTTGRLAGHQLPGMLTHYDRPYLCIEGDWSADEHGRTTMWKGKGTRRPVKGAPLAVSLEQRILTLEARGGLRIRNCPTRRDTLRFIVALYRWWTDADLDDHKSHMAIYAPDFDTGMFKNQPSDFRKALTALLPGVSMAVSKAVEEAVAHIPSVRERLREVLTWEVSEWADLLTVSDKGKARRLGESRARDIMGALK